MKKIYAIMLGVASLFGSVSCDDKLDIVPLGMTTINSTDDLESLLNQQWRVYDWDIDFNWIANQTFPTYTALKEIAGVKDSNTYAWLFCDETVNRVNLAEEDIRYSELYKHINYMNIVISKANSVEGDQGTKDRLVAEARVLRAWFHFLLANFYAESYDEATAAQKGCIAYVDNTNSGEQKTKLSIKEAYDKMLADCSDEVIALLKPVATNDPCRFEADFGYGVRARILLQMKRYDEALKYAKKAIAVNSVIEDRSSILKKGTWELSFDAPNNYLYINSNSIVNRSHMAGQILTPDLLSCFEKGDYLLDYSSEEDWNSYEVTQYGMPGSMMYYGNDARINIYGLRSEHMYYIAAESLIRAGKYDEGLDMMDRVRKNRIHNDFFAPLKGRADLQNEKSAMEVLRKAKRVEFLLNVETYFDFKRYATEKEYNTPLVRDCGSYGTKQLKLDSPLWVYPFPMTATNFNSSLTQNY